MGHLFRPARQHDPRALEWVAGRPLVKHQRYPGIGQDVPGMHGKARNKQDWRAVRMACDIDQRAIRIAAIGHQGGQSPLPASPQQRFSQVPGVEIGGGLHRIYLAILLQ